MTKDKITLTCTGGPYGDCCSSYNFTLNREMTFKEFLELVITQFPREWGSIKERVFGEVIAEYRYGKIIKCSTEDVSFVIKTSGTAHGGWSLMDYVIERKRGLRSKCIKHM